MCPVWVDASTISGGDEFVKTNISDSSGSRYITNESTSLTIQTNDNAATYEHHFSFNSDGFSVERFGIIDASINIDYNGIKINSIDNEDTGSTPNHTIITPSKIEVTGSISADKTEQAGIGYPYAFANASILNIKSSSIFTVDLNVNNRIKLEEDGLIRASLFKGPVENTKDPSSFVDGLKFWSGTNAEYTSISTKDENTIYFVTD